MNNMPTIKVELQGLQESVLHAFIDRQNEIKDYAAECIDGAMNKLIADGLEITIKQVVTETLVDVLHKVLYNATREAIDEYFTNGGGVDFIIAAINKATQKE